MSILIILTLSTRDLLPGGMDLRLRRQFTPVPMECSATRGESWYDTFPRLLTGAETQKCTTDTKNDWGPSAEGDCERL